MNWESAVKITQDWFDDYEVSLWFDGSNLAITDGYITDFVELDGTRISNQLKTGKCIDATLDLMYHIYNNRGE